MKTVHVIKRLRLYSPFSNARAFYYDPPAASQCDWPVLVTGPAQDTVAREGQEALLLLQEVVACNVLVEEKNRIIIYKYGSALCHKGKKERSQYHVIIINIFLKDFN